MNEKQNNQINTENISTDVNDQSRVFDDNGNRIVNKETQFTENLTSYYGNDQMKSKNTLTGFCLRKSMISERGSLRQTIR